jgi:O-antigen/teichoic acid export membrane protein
MTQPVGKSVVLYACAFAVAGVTPFVLLPLLTRAMSPQQFGQVTAFLMMTALLANVAGLSAHGFVSVRYFKMAAQAFAGLAGSALSAMLLAHGVALMLVAAAAPWLHRWFDLPAGWLLLVVAAAACLNVNLVCLAIFQSSGQPHRYLALRMVQACFEIALCVMLLNAASSASAGVRIHSYAFALAASAALGLAWCVRRAQVRIGFDRPHLCGLYTFGLPLLPHIVAGTAIVYVDRLVVSSVLGVDSLGLYMVAMQIGMAMIVLIEPLNKALAPWLFQQLARDDAALRRTIVTRTYALYVALLVAGLGVTALGLTFFDALAGPDYADAKPLVPWMVAGFVLQGMYYSVVNYVFYAERTGKLSTVSAAVATVGAVLSVVLTSRFGLLGAAISFTLNNALLFLLVWRVAAQLVAMPWFFRMR